MLTNPGLHLFLLLTLHSPFFLKMFINLLPLHLLYLLLMFHQFSLFLLLLLLQFLVVLFFLLAIDIDQYSTGHIINLVLSFQLFLDLKFIEFLNLIIQPEIKVSNLLCFQSIDIFILFDVWIVHRVLEIVYSRIVVQMMFLVNFLTNVLFINILLLHIVLDDLLPLLINSPHLLHHFLLIMLISKLHYHLVFAIVLEIQICSIIVLIFVCNTSYDIVLFRLFLIV